ncbi:hypothetical protein [Acidicapsa ligni]|uniref:hypothetical protein n=1 Tax=Acidicapsa ligni TaxID=542300 RepID=UPI0021E0DDC4|nr:hypothetical protein [Acidicapsa ligni]
MKVRLFLVLACVTAGTVLVCSAAPSMAQTVIPVGDKPLRVSSDLPDAPAPQQISDVTVSGNEVLSNAVPDNAVPDNAVADNVSSVPERSEFWSSSSSAVFVTGQQTLPDQQPPSTDHVKTKSETADEQLKVEKKQRILGFLPSFNTSYNSNAVSLTGKQKIRLAFTSATDPVQFAVAGIVSLVDQAEGSDYGYGGGIGGYAKRFGGNYADSFDGAMLGNGILPALLHQDPRYFRRGYGSTKRRMLYALTSSVVCRHDNTGKLEPNYSNMLGNVAAGGISNLYIPADERGVGSTFKGAALVTAEGGVGAILQEFWPDLSRRFFHRDPTNGQDDALHTLHK